MNTITISGAWITSYTNTFPSRRYRYRHDQLTVNGQPIEGCVQVRERSGRVDVTTVYKDRCVLGRQHDWLLRQNGIEKGTTQ